MTQVNILIIDDDKVDRYLLTRDLRQGRIDANIMEHSSSVEALKHLEDLEASTARDRDRLVPQIIFLDINMPCLTGLEFLEAFDGVRGRSALYDSCSIMMVSSSEHPADRTRALGYEFVADFVTKGRTTAEELAVKIESALDLHRVTDDASRA